MGVNPKNRKNGNIVIVIAIAVLLLFTAGGVFAGMTLASINDHTGEMARSDANGQSNNAGSCYLKDEYFTDPADKINLSYARLKLNIPNSVPDEKIQKVIEKVRGAGFNPALALATWNAESSYGTNSETKSDTNGKYEFGYDLEGWGGIDSQLKGFISTLERALKNEGSYGNRPAGEPIQVHWRNVYTPASDARNNISEDRQNICIILNKIVPEQTDEAESFSPLANNISGDLDFRDTGPGLGKDTVGLWANLDEVFEYLGGKSQTNIEKQLVTIKFMEVSVTVNKLIVKPLQQVEKDIIASGSNYHFRQNDTGAYCWRNNVNSPGQSSPHSTGLAIDINWNSNPNTKRQDISCSDKPRDPSCCQTDIPKAVSDAFEKNGFFWGAKFYSVCDSMHFQYGGNYSSKS